MGRFETFASSTDGDEAKILHLPGLRFDVLDRPLGPSPLYWGLGSSLGYLGRSEPGFHARMLAASTFSRTSRCRSRPAAGAWCPRSRCARPLTPSARSLI